MKKSRNAISLTGGLGNQLFQLAFGLNISKSHALELVTDYGAPRHSGQEAAEILNFQLPANVSVSSPRRKSYFVSKSVGYLLRTGLELSKFERIPGIIFIANFLGSMLVSFHRKKIRNIIAGRGVGYFDLKGLRKGTFLIGYFQSYRWASEKSTYEKMKSLSPVFKSDELSNLIDQARIENPLMVHIRLGDYLLESHFGTPSRNYYDQAIRRHFENQNFDSIWLFSDDLVQAIEIIPTEFRPKIRCIDEIHTPTQTLELMRYGAGYVIANSTFSWWGAFLAYNSEVKIIAPNPWFAGMEEPLDLCPPEWIRLEAYRE